MAKTTGKLTDLGRAHHMLEGILKGIGADNIFSLDEAIGLKSWLDLHLNFADLSPFSDLLDLSSQAIAAGKVEDDIEDEVLFFCRKFTAGDGVADSTSKDIRVLHGIMQGISIDGDISPTEAEYIKQWAEAYAPAANIFPYSDLLTLLKRILADGRIDPDEHDELMNFCRNFSERLSFDQNLDITIGGDTHWMQNDAPVLETIEQVCDPLATIEIPRHRFCFTGQASFGSRSDLHYLIEQLGGAHSKDINSQLDYLVIGAKSSPCWMYSTYGRKIEKALTRNEEGKTVISIVHEDIFIGAAKSLAPDFF